MARRNPMNERYGKHTAPSGKTRKSAASAKPKRPASAEVTSGGKKKVAPSASAKRDRIRLDPPTPEFKKWRRIWWACLGSAIVFSTAAWWLWQDLARRPIGNWVLGAGYVMIGVALAIDLLKLRPMRIAWTTGAKPASKQSSAQDKTDSEKTATSDSDES